MRYLWFSEIFYEIYGASHFSSLFVKISCAWNSDYNNSLIWLTAESFFYHRIRDRRGQVPFLLELTNCYEGKKEFLLKVKLIFDFCVLTFKCMIKSCIKFLAAVNHLEPNPIIFFLTKFLITTYLILICNVSVWSGNKLGRI